uniref:receptor-like protein EIX2 n=1 Tax=Erigeron canadensis TaxID=72917 RepID=UPI001CB92971|nr:receptor-like protein EIX2 [Erigeron canadensis]
MKPTLVFLLLYIILMNGGVFTRGLKEDANITVSSSCIEKERQALLILKNHLDDVFGFLHNWGSEEKKKDCCQWVGVDCNHTRHVIILDLSDKGLSGSMSTSLGDLTNLMYLNLRSNNLTGNLPSTVGQLLYLDYLDVSNNSLNGNIPDFTGCPSLAILDLSSNDFTRNLPTSVNQLLNLVAVNVSHNSLNGNIPDFTGYPSLYTLDLSSNNFTGDLPESIGKLTNLRYLYVNNNSFNGNIPDFTGCPLMSALDLSENNLTGHLPISVGQLSNLDYLDASSNSLNGVISDLHFQNLTLLTYLDLSFNSFLLELTSIPSQVETIKLQSCKLGPHFPIWLKTQHMFTYLDISSAGISHRIPSWFWDHLPSRLNFLNISSNEIKDVIPDIKVDFDEYPGIDLSDNQFVGTAPLFPSKLAALLLSGNKLSGNISFLCQIDKAITLIDLSNNSFTGNLPDCWSKFQNNLTILNLSNNKLSGKIPSSLGNLSRLEALYLRNNTFIGELPLSLSNCTKLRFVDLGENNLSGMIPAWIGERLTDLYVLVLRSNRFLGTLPTQVCWLYKLQFLDLSENKLSGNIPECVGNLTAMFTKPFGYDMCTHFYSSYATTKYVYGRSEYTNMAGAIYRSLQPNSGETIIEATEEGLFTDIALVAWKGKLREFGRSILVLLKSIDLSNNNFSGILPNKITNLTELVSLNLSGNKFHGQVPKDIGKLKSLEFLDLSRNEFSGSIPLSLSWVDSLGYLDLSNNNFSGKIPLDNGDKLQSFNSSSYSGNPLLCGLPLTLECGVIHDHGKHEDEEEEEEEESEVWKSYYIGIGVGFAVGFWGICGAVFLNRRCRHFLFVSLSHVKDWIYVTMVVYLWKLKRL